MSVEEELDKLNKKIDDYHKENARISNFKEWRNLSFIAWAFSLATASLYFANPNLANAWVSIIFLILGFIMLIFGIVKYK